MSDSRISLASAARFLASGGFNTAITYVLYLALLHWLPYRQSYSIAFACGIALAYALNRYYVFRRPGGQLGPLLVGLIYLGQYLLGLLIVSLWVGWLGAPAAVAPLAAIAISLPLTYLCNAFVFGRDAQGDPATAAMRTGVATTRLRTAIAALLLGLPALSLLLNAIAWVSFGFDLPFFDDWRAYGTGQIDSLDPAYLFMGINDTIAPIGFALDALAQRFLAGNSVAYQLLSMLIVLGLLLLLQWKLLNAVLGHRLQAAGCFVFTLLMLQPGSYWGRENMAYHQALPLVFLLSSLWLIALSKWKNAWRLPAILGLGLLAGLTYISGAFGALAAAAGILCVVAAAHSSPARTRVAQGAAVLGLAGAATSIAQFVLGVIPSLTAVRRAAAPLALPYQRDFWLFYFGKIGRSLLLPEDHALRSLGVVLLACLCVAGLAFVLIRRLRCDATGRLLPVAVVYGALCATVFVYLMLVAAGRTNLREPEIRSLIDVFLLGFTRFHFFWVTLLWPWVIATSIILLRQSGSTSSRRLAMVGWLGCAAGIALMVAGGALAHFARHSTEASYRRDAVNCLMKQLQQGDGIDCPEFNTPDLTPAYIYADRTGASFVRYFPLLPIDIGVNEPPPWFRLTRDSALVKTQDITIAPKGYIAGPDSQILIPIGRPDEMANCVMLDVQVIVAAAQDDATQLYFRPRDQAEFSEANSRFLPITGGAPKKLISFRVESERGFEDTLRIDPVGKAQPFVLPDLEVRCRLRYTTGPFFKMGQPPTLGQVVASAWLDPNREVPNGYHAGTDAQVEFQTQKPLQMSECSLLSAEARVTVQQPGRARMYYRRRGDRSFSEDRSVDRPVLPNPAGDRLVFRLESPIGFEDRLRFDPVETAQDIRIEDVQVRCLRRRASTRAAAVPAARPGPSKQP